MVGRSSQVARGLITIAARIVGDEGKQALHEYGIEVENLDGSLNSTYDILGQVAQIWGTLTDVQRTSLGETLAGKTRFNILSAVMTNFQHAIEATETALNSEGSAMQENIAFMEGLESRTNLLSATFQNLANDVIPKELVANGLNVLNKALELLDTNLGVILTRITLLTGIGWGMSSLLHVANILPNIVSQFKTFASVISGTTTAFAGFHSIALPVIAIITTLGMVIGGFVKSVRDANKDVTEAKNNVKQYNEELNNLLENKNKEVASVKSATNVTEAYLKRIDELDKKTNKTNEEQLEYHSLLVKITNIMPSVAGSIDLETNSIIGGTTAIREQIQAWKDLAIVQAYQENLTEVYKQQANAQLDYQKQLDKVNDLQAQRNALIDEEKMSENLRIAYKYGKISDSDFALFSKALPPIEDTRSQIGMLSNQLFVAEKALEVYANGLEEINDNAVETEKALNALMSAGGISEIGETIDYAEQAANRNRAEYNLRLAQWESFLSGDDSTDGGGTGTTVKEIDQVIEEIVFNLQDFISLSKSEIDLLESEYSLMEAQGMSADDLNTKVKEIQNAYHAEAEILRVILSHAEEYNLTQEDINDIQTEINNRSIAWWNWQSKIKQDTEEILYDYQSIADEYQKIIDTHSEELQQQKDALTALQERMSDYYQEQINDIDNQIDALREANDEIENQISLQEKLDALARAKQSRLLVYSDGGWHYISDADTVSAATKDIESFKRTQALEENIAGLEAQKTVLQEVQNSWRNMSQDYDKIQNDWLINQQLGIDTTRDNWQTLVADAQTYATQYLAIMSAISEISGLSISGLAYNPNIDYHALMLSSKTYEEAMKWGAYRDAKIIGEGIVPNKTTQQILNEWTSGKVSSLNGSNSNRATSLIQNAHSFATNKDAISLAQKMGLIPTGVKGLPSIPNVGQKVTNMTVQSLNLPNVTNVQQFVDYVKDNMFAKTLQFVH